MMEVVLQELINRNLSLDLRIVSKKKIQKFTMVIGKRVYLMQCEAVKRFTNVDSSRVSRRAVNHHPIILITPDSSSQVIITQKYQMGLGIPLLNLLNNGAMLEVEIKRRLWGNVSTTQEVHFTRTLNKNKYMIKR
ncbi:hypothetical protein M8J77_016744 [Diaphorina citri]|nr:hypothetical protein M8J77_016744 [Diaphorina citri]